MRKVDLRAMEDKKFRVIKNIIDKGGNKKRAALKLGVTLRTINRLIIVYKESGKAGFIHGNRSRKPKNIINDKTKDLILYLYEHKYKNFNFKHFQDCLLEEENIRVSYNVLHGLLSSQNILSPKAQRVTKKKVRTLIKKKLEDNKRLLKSEEKLVVESNILDPKSNHSRLPRSKYSGELLQMDASEHVWFGVKKTHLHAAIDDATGAIVGAYFDHQETLNGYYNVLKQCLSTNGIPAKFLTDRRTIFDYKRKKNPQPEHDTLTQFGYACEQLGIELATTSVAQAKGRIERLFGTLQSRLINDMKLANINNINQANEFLIEYIYLFNQKFSLINYNIPHVYEKLNDKDDINIILGIVSSRIFDSGSSLKYKNKYYQAYYPNGRLINFRNKTKATIIESFDNILYSLVNNNYYKLVELPKHEKFSKEFDLKIEDKPVKKYIPPKSHPWKQRSFQNYLERKNR